MSNAIQKFQVYMIRTNSNGDEKRDLVDMEFESKYAAKKYGNNRLDRDEYYDDYEIVEKK